MKEIEKAIADIKAGYHTDFTIRMSLQALEEKLKRIQPCRNCMYFDVPDNEYAPCQSCKRMVRVNDYFKLNCNCGGFVEKKSQLPAPPKEE